MTQILVPTDFSENSGYAEKAAMNIAKSMESEITFVHGLSVGVDWTNLPKDKESKYPAIQTKIREAEDALGNLVSTALEQGTKADHSIAYLEGYKSVSAMILEQACDLIVMGPHGRGAKALAIGSNTGKVLRTAKAPVLVIQSPVQEPLNFRTIVFASAFEPDTHQVFDRLLDFANRIGAENLHLVEVTTPGNFRPSGIVEEEMQKFIAHHNCKAIWLHNYNHYNVEAGIIEFAHKVGADLISIANHGRSDISSLFIESIPENLVKYSDFPVLSIRA